MLCSPQQSPNDDGNKDRGRSRFKAMWRKNCDDKEENDDGHVWCDSREDPPCFGQTTTTTMIQTMSRTSRAYVSSACTHATNTAQKQFWLCNPAMVEGNECFAKHITWHHDQEIGGRGK